MENLDNSFFKRIGALRKKYQKIINNIYIWSSINIEALKNAKMDSDFLTKQQYLIVSNRKKKTVKRDENEILSLINNALESEYYYSIFTFAVAQCESFLFDIIKEILVNDNRKIKISISGINICKSIEVNDIIDCFNKEELIDEIINKNLASIFYAAPKYQLEYLSKIAGISDIDDLFNDWIEIKASRDIIIHNQGIVNKIYIDKTCDRARQSINKKIIIDNLYFEKSLVTMKSLIGRISSKIQNNCKSKVDK